MWEKKYKEAEVQHLQITKMKDEYESQVKDLNIELNNLNTSSTKELMELEKKLKEEFSISSQSNIRDIQKKIKELENARQSLHEKNSECMEKIKGTEKANALALSKAEKDIIKLKDDNFTLQKENAALQSALEKSQSEQQIKTTTIERY